MARLIDISVSLSPDVPVWPGDDKPRFIQAMSLQNGDDANVTNLNFCVHTGTHIDAPLHFVDGAKSVDQLPPELFVGPVQVIDCRGLDKITDEDLVKAAMVKGTERLLFKTDNSRHWVSGNSAFDESFVALTPKAAQWVTDFGIKLVGIDYLSIERFGEPGNKTHHILLGNGIIVIEGLDLSMVEAGRYELMCLPLKLKGVEGAPARVFLRELD